eukprot:GDKJ01025581.1.p1 GENE.GDKJ01025581.1~~GDKJ01025581.1.p1  ORF type:complete len:1263 (+),score=264.92 GDKJ01025581.1:24-3812(+)
MFLNHVGCGDLLTRASSTCVKYLFNYYSFIPLCISESISNLKLECESTIDSIMNLSNELCIEKELDFAKKIDDLDLLNKNIENRFSFIERVGNDALLDFRTNPISLSAKFDHFEIDYILRLELEKFCNLKVDFDIEKNENMVITLMDDIFQHLKPTTVQTAFKNQMSELELATQTVKRIDNSFDFPTDNYQCRDYMDISSSLKQCQKLFSSYSTSFDGTEDFEKIEDFEKKAREKSSLCGLIVSTRENSINRANFLGLINVSGYKCLKNTRLEQLRTPLGSMQLTEQMFPIISEIKKLHVYMLERWPKSSIKELVQWANELLDELDVWRVSGENNEISKKYISSINQDFDFLVSNFVYPDIQIEESHTDEKKYVFKYKPFPEFDKVNSISCFRYYPLFRNPLILPPVWESSLLFSVFEKLLDLARECLRQEINFTGLYEKIKFSYERLLLFKDLLESNGDFLSTSQIDVDVFMKNFQLRYMETVMSSSGPLSIAKEASPANLQLWLEKALKNSMKEDSWKINTQALKSVLTTLLKTEVHKLSTLPKFRYLVNCLDTAKKSILAMQNQLQLAPEIQEIRRKLIFREFSAKVLQHAEKDKWLGQIALLQDFENFVHTAELCESYLFRMCELFHLDFRNSGCEATKTLLESVKYRQEYILQRVDEIMKNPDLTTVWTDDTFENYVVSYAYDAKSALLFCKEMNALQRSLLGLNVNLNGLDVVLKQSIFSKSTREKRNSPSQSIMLTHPSIPTSFEDRACFVLFMNTLKLFYPRVDEEKAKTIISPIEYFIFQDDVDDDDVDRKQAADTVDSLQAQFNLKFQGKKMQLSLSYFDFIPRCKANIADILDLNYRQYGGVLFARGIGALDPLLNWFNDVFLFSWKHLLLQSLSKLSLSAEKSSRTDRKKEDKEETIANIINRSALGDLYSMNLLDSLDAARDAFNLAFSQCLKRNTKVFKHFQETVGGLSNNEFFDFHFFHNDASAEAEESEKGNAKTKLGGGSNFTNGDQEDDSESKEEKADQWVRLACSDELSGFVDEVIKEVSIMNEFIIKIHTDVFAIEPLSNFVEVISSLLVEDRKEIDKGELYLILLGKKEVRDLFHRMKFNIANSNQIRRQPVDLPAFWGKSVFKSVAAIFREGISPDTDDKDKEKKKKEEVKNMLWSVVIYGLGIVFLGVIFFFVFSCFIFRKFFPYVPNHSGKNKKDKQNHHYSVLTTSKEKTPRTRNFRANKIGRKNTQQKDLSFDTSLSYEALHSSDFRQDPEDMKNK